MTGYSGHKIIDYEGGISEAVLAADKARAESSRMMASMVSSTNYIKSVSGVSDSTHWSKYHVPEFESKPIREPKAKCDPMYLIGHTYKQLNGDVVLIVGAANQGSTHETVYSITPSGKTLHRYSRRDFGRCTGSSSDCETNLERVK